MIVSLATPLITAPASGPNPVDPAAGLAPEPLQLLWQHRASGAVSRWEVDRAAPDRATRPIAVPTPTPAANWHLAGTGDFDRDGRVDQLWRQQFTGENQLWLSRNPHQSPNTAMAPMVIDLPRVRDRDWQVAGVADFNGDQQLDILWRHQVCGENQVWLMDALQPQSMLELETVADRQWQLGGLADFDRNGQSDIVWRNQASGTNIVWLMQGSQKIGQWALPDRRDPDWQISGVADVNQDGSPDLLWSHASDGVNQVWLMQGQARQQEMALDRWTDPAWQLAAIAPTRAAMAANLPNAADLPLNAPPPSQSNFATPRTLPAIELAVTDLTIKPLAIGQTPRELPVSVQFNHPSAGTDRVKVSFFLSTDAVISSRDRFLGATTTTAQPNQLSTIQQTLQLPELTDPFWQRPATTAITPEPFYVGVVIEGLNTAPETNILNNRRSVPLTIAPPLLQAYEFVYDYNGVGDLQDSDFYRGQVIAPVGTYAIGQWIDVVADRNQSGSNGRYQITGSQYYQGDRATGWVEVSEYFDQETGQRYQPIGANGRDYLGSESGYIQSRQTNRDRFGADFYEVDRDEPNPIAPIVSVAPRSNDPIIQSLINPFNTYWDTRQNGGIITYSFYQATGVDYDGSEIVAPVSAGIQRNVRRILTELERIIPVRFVEVIETATTVGAIRYLLSEGEGDAFYAYTYYPGRTIGGDVHLSRAIGDAPETGFAAAPGSYGYRALLHETLHALGLKHPGNYDAGAGTAAGPFLTIATDNSTNTVMSYNQAGSHEITTMDYDRRALQFLYGTPANDIADTTYQFTSLTQYQVGKTAFGDRSRSTKQTITDSGGTDTLDFSGLAIARDHRFDLRPGGILTAQTAYNTQGYRDGDGAGTGAGQQQFLTSESGVVLSSTTLIENLVNSSGNDFVIANAAANRFSGYRLGVRSGNDVIAQSDSADQVILQDYAVADLQSTVNDEELLIRLAGDGILRILDYFRQPLDFRLNGQSYRYDRAIGWVAVVPTVPLPDLAPVTVPQLVPQLGPLSTAKSPAVTVV
jgi:hypothetical protein